MNINTQIKETSLKHLRKAINAVLIITLFCLSLFVCGCRYSDALFEIIIDPDLGTLEPHANPEYYEKEGAPENPNLASVHLSENENYANQAAFIPVYKEDATVNGQAVRRTYAEETPNDTDATEGNELSEDIEFNAQTSEDTEITDDPNASSADDQTTEESQTGENADDNQPDNTGGRGGVGQVYGDGSYDDLPDAKAVAAKGQYALITQMLSGKGGLAAADVAWIQDMQARGIFVGEGLDGIARAWDASGVLDMSALIASDADTILIDGLEASLSASQQETIMQAGINIVHVPILGQTYTPDAQITEAVQVVGQVLSGLNSQAAYSTADMVERYINMHDTVINGCLNANGGYSYKLVNGRAYQGIYQGTSTLGQPTSRLSSQRASTACIDSWTASSGSSITAKREFGFHNMYLNGRNMDISDGVGLSASTVGGNFILGDYYLQTAGVVNNAYDSPRPVSDVNGTELSLPYAVVPGTAEGLTARQIGARQIPSALWYSETGTSIQNYWTTVGDINFPGVIVRDANIANNVARSAAKTNGLYNTGQTYKIYQIPQGVAGNWFDGNVESFMTSVWAYSMFREGNADSAKEWVDGFYQLFYRVNDNATSHFDAFDNVTTATCPKD